MLARALDAMKQWPLWLFIAIALSLTVFVIVPDFRNLAPPAISAALVFSTIVAWIFTCTRAAKPLTEVVLAYLHHRDQSRYFFVTPIDHQSHWHVSKQPDGSSVTQVGVHCMVKNRSTEPLYIMKARVIKPKIRGEVLPGLVGTRAPDASIYGAPHFGYCTLLIRGVPRQKAGAMQATIEFEDADGHRERIKVLLAGH
jgi:hypothetical protein